MRSDSCERQELFYFFPVTESVRERDNKLNSTIGWRVVRGVLNLHCDKKIVRREPERDRNILRDLKHDGNVAVGGIGTQDVEAHRPQVRYTTTTKIWRESQFLKLSSRPEPSTTVHGSTWDGRAFFYRRRAVLVTDEFATDGYHLVYILITSLYARNPLKWLLVCSQIFCRLHSFDASWNQANG